ncbi:PE family protein [Mycobacterium sp. E796]|uniref:PE family protein n=1 Tax=Mycobacterium sp. E796 TaxID=1834151 RepID=UPI000801AF88|nr:PE family protein [Mycobacterium sp. E796]OBI64601.1 hypothetical protein A5706_15435 [Mycobacterium sp. E796]
MSFVIAAPDIVTAATTDLENIGSTINAASSAAAASTTALLPAAGDEVSAAVTALFASHGRAFQALSAQASSFHEEFVQALAAAAGSYASTEAATVSQLEAALQGGVRALAPAAGTGFSSIAGPYETLFANTGANLQILGGAIAANPAPFFRQFLINQIGYAQTITAAVEHVLQNLPAVLASLPANIQAAIQALLAFNPVPLVQQIIANQLAYAQIIATSLQNAARDFVIGLEQLPAAFQSAVQALLAGNVGGAVSDIAQGFLSLFFTGVTTAETGDALVPPGIAITVTPAGSLGDLLPILSIPGLVAQNFTNLLPPGSIPAQVSQNFTNVVDTLTNTSVNATALLGLGTGGLSAALTTDIGLPAALLIDAVGAPVNAFGAVSASASQFVGELQTGNLTGAVGTLVDAPAVVTDAFLNGQTNLPLSIAIPNQTISLGPLPLGGTLSFTNGNADIAIPLDGILVPETPITGVITGTATGTGLAGIAAALLVNGQLPLDVDVFGTPTSGLVTALLVFAPEQLALAITPAA